MSIPEVTLSQLGGRRFIAMTGARHFVADGNALRFKLPQGARSGINLVTITLTPDDVYRVTFARFRGQSLATVAEVDYVYADQLGEVFTHHTGLDVRL